MEVARLEETVQDLRQEAAGLRTSAHDLALSQGQATGARGTAGDRPLATSAQQSQAASLSQAALTRPAGDLEEVSCQTCLPLTC